MEHTARWAVDVDLFQHEHGTTAHAVLHGGGTRLMGVGSVRWVERGLAIGEVGDELAVSRALVDLGRKLEATAVDDTAGILGTARAADRQPPTR